MGSLKPGVTYIYEQSGNVTYAREFGSSERQAIGWDYDPKNMLNEFADQKMWANILKEAETNHTLQQSLERVILLYKLSVSKYD